MVTKFSIFVGFLPFVFLNFSSSKGNRDLKPKKIKDFPTKSELLEGKVSDEKLNLIISFLEHPDLEIQERAVWAIGCIGPKAHKAVPILIKIINQKKMEKLVIWALGNIGEKAKQAEKELKGILKNGNDYLKIHAAWALNQIDKKNDIGPFIIQCLNNKDFTIKFETILILGKCQFNPQDKKNILKSLGYCIISKNKDIRHEALVALDNFSNEEIKQVIPFMAKTFFKFKNDKFSKDMIIFFLAIKIKTKNKEVISVYKEGLKFEEKSSLLPLIRMIGEMKINELASDLTFLLKNQNLEIRLEILKALGQIGPDAKISPELIIKILEMDSRSEIQKEAKKTLKKIGKGKN